MQFLCQLQRFGDYDLSSAVFIVATEEFGIQFQDIQRHVFQGVQRRITCSEIIHRYHKSEFLQFLDRCHQRRLIIKECALCQLNLDQFVRSSLGIHQIPDLLGQIALRKMRSGNVNGNRYTGIPLIHPFLLVSCHTADHIGIDLGNKSVLFKDRDDRIRSLKTIDRRLPADQRLCAAQAVRLRIILRLIEYHKLFILQRSLLVLLYNIQPLLLFDHLLIKVCNRRIVIICQCFSCRAGIVILLLQICHTSSDQPPLPHVMPFADNAHTDMETESVDTVHDFQILHQFLQERMQLLLIVKPHQHSKVCGRIMRAQIILLNILHQKLIHFGQDLFTFFDRVTHAEITILDKRNIDHCKITLLRIRLLQQLLTLDHKPHPVTPAGHIIHKEEIGHLALSDDTAHDVIDNHKGHAENHHHDRSGDRRQKDQIRSIHTEICLAVKSCICIAYLFRDPERNIQGSAFIRKFLQTFCLFGPFQKSRQIKRHPVTFTTQQADLPVFTQIYFFPEHRQTDNAAALAAGIIAFLEQDILIPVYQKVFFLFVSQKYGDIPENILLLIQLRHINQIFILAVDPALHHIPQEHIGKKGQKSIKNQRYDQIYDQYRP